MSSQLTISGSYVIAPLTGASANGEPTISTPFDEMIITDRSTLVELRLTSDVAVSVAFGGVDEAVFVAIHASGGKVSATLTSADGTDQIIPVDPIGLLLSESVPFTALSLTRATGTTVDVRVVLADKA